jgi:hypothetical protein
MSPSPHLRTETDPLSEMLCFLKYQTMDKAQEPSNPECYTPPSKPYRICLVQSSYYVVRPWVRDQSLSLCTERMKSGTMNHSVKLNTKAGSAREHYGRAEQPELVLRNRKATTRRKPNFTKRFSGFIQSMKANAGIAP